MRKYTAHDKKPKRKGLRKENKKATKKATIWSLIIRNAHLKYGKEKLSVKDIDEITGIETLNIKEDDYELF